MTVSTSLDNFRDSFWLLCIAMDFEAQDELQAVIETADVIFFDLETCPFCREAERVLQAAGVAFKKVRQGGKDDVTCVVYSVLFSETYAAAYQIFSPFLSLY